MQRTKLLTGTALILAVPTLMAIAGFQPRVQVQDEPGEAQQLLPPETRFDGVITVTSADGTRRDVRVLIQNWSIRPGLSLDRLPVPGYLIVLVRSELTTVINGQRQERQEGDFLTVPAGTALGLETGNDMAVIQVVSIQESG